jgi:hypothetical protein
MGNNWNELEDAPQKQHWNVMDLHLLSTVVPLECLNFL